MSPTIFWRIAPNSLSATTNGGDLTLEAPPEFLARVKPRHGIVIAEWDAEHLVGRVRSFAVITSVAPSRGTVNIERKEVDVTLRPNPSGRIYWSGRLFFQFAKDVAIRYMLSDLFAEHFPEFDNLEFAAGAATGVSTSNSTGSIGGYVYVIRSPYGFKIGKTVNIRSRTRLFEVRLPFPISVEHYAWFDDYSKAERMFHEMYFHKRLEGEWFDLTQSDLDRIRSYGEIIPVAGVN